jgi:pimeloyl-ACP methyl ester carboxylesterase
MTRIPYDEFSMFHENAAEFGIPFDAPPVVRRVSTDLGDGRRISALRWYEGEPELVFLHGGAQNAHTWDTVALALKTPLLCIDLPGHGHSDQARSGALDVRTNAEDIARVIAQQAPNAKAVIGMSLGGLTTLALSEYAPELVRRVVLVDITPGVTGAKSQAITAFVNGPETFPDFDALLQRTIEHNPTRSVMSLRRGILHNARQLDDGSWVWRHRRFADARHDFARFGELWGAVSGLQVPLMLVRGMRAQSVVDDADEAELLQRCPSARIERIEQAGHSVQGDTPVELATAIRDFALG